MSDFRVESTRGDLVESVHRVSVAVVDADGRLVASAGDPDMVTFWRSAAKPFQALPLLADGAADAFGLDDEELALACASHSSERMHLEVAARFLRKIGAAEEDLACGPHPPLGSAVAEMVARTGLSLTPRWSNCSGKHAGMLALARHRGWETPGYERLGHPVQERMLVEVERWTGVPRSAMHLAVDGCTAVCFGLPLRGMALSYARLARSRDPGAERLRRAITGHPALIAGTGRFCTELMAAWPGGVIAKVGAEGVYSAALLDAALGIAVKVEDGDMRTAPVALMGVLSALADRLPAEGQAALERLASRGRLPTRNTRGEVTGYLACAGELRYSD
ncbi:MAG TPA: asparaginase [Gemmatimonadales bacterium]|nr:asparaginase [Gemmatimonadales bacterium]